MQWLIDTVPIELLIAGVVVAVCTATLLWMKG
jgi:hypothetical protein